MTIRNLPRAIWIGLALIAVSSIAHLWLEIDRGMRVAPQLKQGPEFVARTYEVIATAQALGRAVQDAERSQHDYLLTGDAAHLQAYRMGTQAAPALLAKLNQLTADNPEQQRRWPILERQVELTLGEMQRMLELRERGAAAVVEAAQSTGWADSMRTINDMLDAAVATEYGLLTERLSQAARYERWGRGYALAGGLLALAVLALGVGLVLVAVRNILKAEAARSDSEQRFRFFVRGVVDYAIYMLDPKGIVMEWNAGAERIKGYSAAEIVGQHFSRFYTEEDRAAGLPERALQKAVQEGRFEAEGWRVRKDGSRFFASAFIDPLRDEAGRLVGFAKITRDIDERVQQQQALAQYQKMDALGQLTGGIAHDFNNLIHVIRNSVGQLEKRLQGADGEAHGLIEMLKRNADRAASLTQRLLAFSRRQVLDPRPISPGGLIADTTALVRQAVGEGIAIETVAGAGTWSIYADANQLETALLNLALNARDSMGGIGKLTIEISNAFLDEDYASLHAEVKPGQYVMIAVSDTGTGMRKEVVARAFDPFFTTKEMGQGTGLGLSQVYGFIKQSGGHAKIYSEPGEGTSVKLYLPRYSGAPAAQVLPNAPAAVAAGKEEGTILLVEDDEDVCRFTAEMLRDLGYRVLSAGEAVSALRLLDENPDVALLFTDIGLPGGVNGRQLADEAQKRRPQLRILYTTGYTRNAVIHQGRLDPGVALIQKPFTQNVLAAKVRQSLLEPRQGG